LLAGALPATPILAEYLAGRRSHVVIGIIGAVRSRIRSRARLGAFQPDPNTKINTISTPEAPKPGVTLAQAKAAKGFGRRLAKFPTALPANRI
jgi:hypothetical protein